MNAVQTTLQAALDGLGDEPLERIEIEFVGTSFYWHLWSAGQRVFSAEADAGQIAGMMEATRLLTHVALGVPPVGPASLRVDLN